MSATSRVISFADRRTAYGFVAELRRLYELDRFVGLMVQSLQDEVVVELPDAPPDSELADLAERHGGHLAARPDEAKRLRLAIANARLKTRATTRRVRTMGGKVAEADPQVRGAGREDE